MDDGTLPNYAVNAGMMIEANGITSEQEESVEPLELLRRLGAVCAAVSFKLRSMSASEREFWATRAYQRDDRRTRRHQASYGRRRATRCLSQWRTTTYE